jgi:hypothetical protein
VTDWTVIGTAAIAASSAVVGSALGYATSRHVARVELRKFEAENERLRTQHGEEHLRHRQAVYHDFLDSAHRFHQDAGGTEPFARPAEAQRWLRAFEHCLSAVSLFGTERAWHAADEVARAVEHAMGQAPRYDGEPESRFLAAWRACVEAMREDSAPRD